MVQKISRGPEPKAGRMAGNAFAILETCRRVFSKMDFVGYSGN